MRGICGGGIPERDIDAIDAYWRVIPAVRATLFEFDRPGYGRLRLPIAMVKAAILEHSEFTAFNQTVTALLGEWQVTNWPRLRGFDCGDNPKVLIETIAEDLLTRMRSAALLDAYDLYQHLMDYWAETMQDDCYIVAADGWVAETYRIVETDKKGKEKDKGWACDLVPKALMVGRYFTPEQGAIEMKQAELEAVTASLTELEEEQGGEEGFLGMLEKINKAEVNGRLKEIKGDKDAKEEAAVLKQWLTMLGAAVQGELDRVSQTLTGRVRQLAERYAEPLPKLEDEVEVLAARVAGHLKRMGF